MFDVPSPSKQLADAGQEISDGFLEAAARMGEAIKASGISFSDVRTPRLLCGADLGAGLTCRRAAGHERVGPDCSSMTVEQERAETERALNGGTSLLEALPAVSNPAPGLWELVTGKPLPSYAELLERGRRAEHPTYDLLNVQSTRAPELSSAEACDRLTAAIERPRLAARITEVLPPALASQLALAVEEAVRRGIRAHVEAEKAVLNQLAEGATARLQQSIEDQKRGREANAERWTTPSRLS
jgi:hypothetical protein